MPCSCSNQFDVTITTSSLSSGRSKCVPVEFRIIQASSFLCKASWFSLLKIVSTNHHENQMYPYPFCCKSELVNLELISLFIFRRLEQSTGSMLIKRKIGLTSI